ncbi:MAG: carboxypeptidase-like regulatory domain-containing protein, partial [Thermoanaerobaculia bacterium]
MKLRTLGIVTLILLVAGLLWTLRPRESQPAPVAPTPTPNVGMQVDAAALEPAMAASPVRESAQPAPVPDPAPVIGAHTTADFALIKVLVLNKTTRAPMPDIDVHGTYDMGERSHRIEPTTRSHGKPFETLHTDAEGRVEIEMPPNVISQVNAYGRKQDAGTDHADITALQRGAVHEVVLELPTGDDMPYWMKFVDETSRAPLAGVHVGPGAGGESKLTSDEQGLALWQGRTWSPGILHVDADGYARAYFKPEPGHAESSAAFVVALPKCASVSVHVVDGSGHAIAGAKLELETEGYNLGVNGGASSMALIDMEDPHWRGVTDGSGHATIACLPPHIAIRAGVTSPKNWNAPDKLVLEPGETRRLEWTLTKGCGVHGIVLDQSNAPVTQREMWMRKAERKFAAYFNSYSGDETRSTKTDEQGRFRFEDVGTGTWWVGPSAPGYAAKVAVEDVAAVAQVVEVANGQSDIDLTLRVDRGLFIRGELLNAKGEPAKGGSVTAYDQVQNLYTSTNMPARDNSFVIGPLVAGHYVLTARGFEGDANSDPVE